MSKVIVLDFGIFSHRAIFASLHNKAVPPTYTCLSMMLGNLSRIGVDPDDTIIVACDGRGNWRKEYEQAYKANRSEQRAKSGIDWESNYKQMNDLLYRIDLATDWHILQFDQIEADDIASVCCRFYKDKEVVLVSYDSDWELLWHYEGVKIFSPLTKRYKVKKPKFNAYELLAKKVKKETSDNLISPLLNEQDYEYRLKCVNLLELPVWVENTILEILKILEPKEGLPDYIPFKSLQSRYNNLYNDKSKLLTYEKCIKRENRKKKKRRKK